MKEIKSKLLIIVNIEFLCIDLRKNIERSLGLYGCDSRNVIECLVDKISLLINSSAWLNVLIYTLVTAKSGLHDGLCRNVGAKTHGGKHINAFNIALCLILRTA